MTDTRADRKWFYRCIMLMIIALMSYVAFQPSYNFAHWVPHSFLRGLGIPYSALLYFETHADKILHPLGAAVITVLLIFSQIPFLTTKFKILCTVTIALVCAEIIQAMIGRGFDVTDLVLGVIGSYLAYILITNR